MTVPDPIGEIERLFRQEGAREYLGEAVSQAEHMLQAGALARAAGAPDALVAACLLHDVGHFHGVMTGRDLMEGRDNLHSDTGAAWLSAWFGPAVTEPVRWHVAAKRYLCAIDPAYLRELSAASLHTLCVQGGPLSEAEAAAFAALPYAADAVALRRWDDQAKDPTATTPGFDSFRPLLEGLRFA
jgi:gamma-butyrobetaine dioxygenase